MYRSGLVCVLVVVFLLSGCSTTPAPKINVVAASEGCPTFSIASDWTYRTEGALTAQERANLETFARLYGYVRYFHPSDEVAKADWEMLLWNGVALTEDAATPEELASRLNALFCPIAPTLQVYATSNPPAPIVLDVPAQGEITQWEHHGAGSTSTGTPVTSPVAAYAGNYYSIRTSAPLDATGIPEGYQDPNSPFSTDLGAGVSARLPLALYKAQGDTLPHGTPDTLSILPIHSESGFTPTYTERTTRLGEIVLYWNLMQHFAPYLPLAPADWQAALGEALDGAAVAQDGDAYWRTLRRLNHHQHDGHADGLYMPESMWADYAYLPVKLAYVESQVVVVRVLDENLPVRVGDVVNIWNGTPMAEVVTERLTYVSAGTVDATYTNAMKDLQRGRIGESVTLEIQRGDAPRQSATLTYTMPTVEWHPQTTVQHPEWEALHEVAPGIYYISLARITHEELEENLTTLQAARGMIVDDREYPGPDASADPVVPLYMMPAEYYFTSITIPVFRLPDQREVETNAQSRSVGFGETVGVPLIYLINSETLSLSEHLATIAQGKGEGILVGSPSVGSNGDINVVHLPSGFVLMFTQRWAVKPDGNLFYGEGVIPSHLVYPTIADVAAGRDTLLDYAIGLIE